MYIYIYMLLIRRTSEKKGDMQGDVASQSISGGGVSRSSSQPNSPHMSVFENAPVVLPQFTSSVSTMVLNVYIYIYMYI